VRFRRYMNVIACPNRGGRPESRNIPRVQLVIIPTSCSATPFDEGEYDTDEIIRILRSSHNSFILPATSSFSMSNMTILTFFLVPFCSRLTHFSNSITASDFALKGEHPAGLVSSRPSTRTRICTCRLTPKASGQLALHGLTPEVLSRVRPSL